MTRWAWTRLPAIPFRWTEHPTLTTASSAKSTAPSRSCCNPDRSRGFRFCSPGYPRGDNHERKGAGMTTTERDVIEILTHDHREVEGMFAELESLQGADSP